MNELYRYLTLAVSNEWRRLDESQREEDKAEFASAVGTQCSVSTRGDGLENTSVKAARGTVTKSWQSERPHSHRSNRVSASPAPPNATSLMKRCLA